MSSVTSTGATWNLVKAQTKDDGVALAVDTEIWAALNVSGALATITVNLSGAAFAAFGFLSEHASIVTVSAVDQTASNSGAAASLVDSGTTPQTTTATQLWVVALTNASAYTFNGSPSNGFSAVDGEIGFSLSGEYCDQYVQGIGAANASDSTDAYTGIWAGCVATFKASQIIPPASYTGISEVLDYQQVEAVKRPRELTVIPPFFAILPPTGQFAAPASYSSIAAVNAFYQWDFTLKIDTRLSVRAPSFPIIPPASFGQVLPRQYSGINQVTAFMQMQQRQTWPRKLTVNPPAVFYYTFTVSDVAHGTEAVRIGLLLSETAHGVDALTGLTATITIQEVAHGADALKSLIANLILQDLAHAVEQIILPAAPGDVDVTVLDRIVDVSILCNTVGVVITGYTVKVIVEPD